MAGDGRQRPLLRQQENEGFPGIYPTSHCKLSRGRSSRRTLFPHSPDYCTSIANSCTMVLAARVIIEPTFLLSFLLTMKSPLFSSNASGSYHGQKKGIVKSGLFDRNWYLQCYPDVAAEGADPVAHYLRHGAIEGRDPNPCFSSAWYLSNYPDVAERGINPLYHYIRFGAAEGRNPSALFDTCWYLTTYPDVATAKLNPLAHYLKYGMQEGRLPANPSGAPARFVPPSGAAAAATATVPLVKRILRWAQAKLRYIDHNGPSTEFDGNNAIHRRSLLRADVPLWEEPVETKLDANVLVLSWDVGHNCVGRAYMLAEVLQRVARHVVLAGFQFPRYGKSVWEPIRDATIPTIILPGEQFPEFQDRLEALAARMCADVVIACKPRLPSLQLGSLIKRRHGSLLVIDIDDHELSFFADQRELTVADLSSIGCATVPTLREPYENEWTRLSEHLVNLGDIRLVSNTALQRRFGGVIVPHVRDERMYDPRKVDRNEARRTFGVPVDAKVVLFLGTPRWHKGLAELARAVGEIRDPKAILLIVGTMAERGMQERIAAAAKGKAIFVPNQPFSTVPCILSLADVVCLPQDPAHPASQFQLPAKAIDAAAMNVTLLVTRTPALQDLLDVGLAEVVNDGELQVAIETALHQPGKQLNSRERFLAQFSYSAASRSLKEAIRQGLEQHERAPVHELEVVLSEQRRIFGSSVSEGSRTGGIDFVLFWKQNDSGIYGRRLDQLAKYLGSRNDVRKVLIFDEPISEAMLRALRSQVGFTHGRMIYCKTYEKHFGLLDSGNIHYDVYIDQSPLAKDKRAGNEENAVAMGYYDYVEQSLARHGIRAERSVFVFYPKNFHASGLIDHFRPAAVVADIVDDHRAWPFQSEADRDRLTANYKALLARSDFAFANCEPVREAMRPFFSNVQLIPNGCESKSKPVARADSDAFREYSAISAPIIGFVGNLERKMDIDLLRKIAARFAHCHIALIGSTHANPEILQLSSYPNVGFYGVIPHDEVPAWGARFTVAIIPHLDSTLTRSMNPLKFYDYVSWGKPIVSTSIANIDRSVSALRVADNHETFLASLADALADPAVDAKELAAFVEANSWETRFSGPIDQVVRLSRSRTDDRGTAFELDCYSGDCAVCGLVQTFVRKSRAIRETYNCASCRASLRERSQAQEIIALFGKGQTRSLVDLVKDPGFRQLRIYEPGTSGPFRSLLRDIPGYQQSDYCPASEGLQTTSKMRHEDLHALSFEDERFDLVITSDIFEHVRRPMTAFAEIRRVLRKGGWHVFTVPMQDPIPARSVARVDTSGAADIYLVPPHYHGDGKGGKSLVYTDFGQDLISDLEAIGFRTQLRYPASSSPTANQAVTLISCRVDA